MRILFKDVSNGRLAIGLANHDTEIFRDDTKKEKTFYNLKMIGFKGYENFTREELLAVIRDRFYKHSDIYMKKIHDFCVVTVECEEALGLEDVKPKEDK